MEEHRNLEKFVEKKLYVCKKKYIDIPKDDGQRYGKHFKALKSKIFGILRKESAQLDTLIAAYSLEGLYVWPAVPDSRLLRRQVHVTPSHFRYIKIKKKSGRIRVSALRIRIHRDSSAPRFSVIRIRFHRDPSTPRLSFIRIRFHRDPYAPGFLIHY